LRAPAVIAVLFGLLTIASGGRVLFGSDVVRQPAAAIVGLIVWFNFVAELAHVAASQGLWLRRRRAVAWAGFMASATAAVFAALAAFAAHVPAKVKFRGGPVVR
jgi:hypothetical protein